MGECVEGKPGVQGTGGRVADMLEKHGTEIALFTMGFFAGTAGHHDIIVKHEHKQDRTGDRPDSIELGEARCRIKVYVNWERPDEAARLIAAAVSGAQDAAKLGETANIMGAKK